MKDEHLTHQRLFGKTPQNFSLRVEQTLHGLKEEKTMKKGISGVLVTALVLLVLCAAAFAAVQGIGLDWFYKNVYSNRPLPSNVDKAIQNDIAQTSVHPLLDMKVESAVWLPKGYDANSPEDRVLEILVSIKPKDPTLYEVHPWDSMNADGYRDERKEDYIQTPKGMGPVEEMMTDPKKTLLLFGGQTDHPFTVYNSPGFMLFPSVWYSSHDPEGNVLFYYSCPINDTLLDCMRARYANAENMITLNYSDSSWLWNAKGYTKGNTQEGSITFQIKLPE
jgi:hypothetical protein